LDKPLEYWATLIGMVLYVATRDAEKEPLMRRGVKVLASALLAIGLSPTVAPYLRGSEIAAAVALMAFGTLILDVITAVISDIEFVKKLVERRLGGGGSGNGPSNA
jgi:hypothetical protein